MPRIFLAVVATIALAGCGASLADIRAMNRTHLTQLTIGMSKEDAIRVMGTETITTWEGADRWVINNPYRTEIMVGTDGSSFEVVYYYTDIKRNDLAVTDDELTPIVFNDGRLVGWGWSFLTDAVKRYEIRIR